MRFDGAIAGSARRACRRSLARLDVADYAALADEPHTVANREVAHHPHLPADQHEVADPGTARDAGLGRDHGAAPDADVVGDLHQIVDAAALADHGIGAGSTVDGGVGSDLDIVLDQDAAELGNPHVAALVDREAEALLADPHARKDRYPCADDAVAERSAGPDPRILADLDRSPDGDVGPDQAASAQARAGFDDGAGLDPAPFADRRRRVDDRRRMHLRCGR